jgi:hypothetical protein
MFGYLDLYSPDSPHIASKQEKETRQHDAGEKEWKPAAKDAEDEPGGSSDGDDMKKSVIHGALLRFG